MKKTLRKDIRRSFSHSKSRFISIVLLMFLGSFALVGLMVTGPDMRKTGQHYFNQYNTADITVIDSYGIDSKDIKRIESVSGIKEVEYSYLKDVTIKGTHHSMRVFSKPKSISRYEVIKGRLPQKDDEIAIDDKYKSSYPIGHSLSLTQKADQAGHKVLKRTTYKIVGYVHSSEIVSSLNRGQTTVGTGELNTYGIVNFNNFDSDVMMMAKIRYKDCVGINPYGDAYTKRLKSHKKELEKAFRHQSEIRLRDVKSEYQQKINEAKNKVEQAQNQVAETKQQLSDARIKLVTVQKTIQLSENKLSEAKKTITNQEQQLQNVKTQWNEKNQQYQKSFNELSSKEKQWNEKQATFNKQKQSAYDQIDQQISLIDQMIQSQGESPSLIQQKQILLSKREEYTKQFDQVQSQLDAASLEIVSSKKKLEVASSQLQSSKKQIEAGEIKLNQAKAEYQSKLKELEKGKSDYQENLSTYEKKKQDFDSRIPAIQQKIEEGKEKINAASRQVDTLSAKSIEIDSRRDIPGGEGYKIYSTVSSIVDSLAKIFPVFLYIVASLVTLTTMTRFVNEERINTGTLTALGYSDSDIIKKFTVYGLTASGIGTLFGVLLGHVLLPRIVYNAYHNGFTIPLIECHFYPGITLLAFVLSFLCSVLPTWVMAKKELQEKPAALLLPKPPMNGSSIFLEKIKPLWSRLSFTHKVTARNIFRYKKRMMMTIIGVSGAVSLLFTGFSVQHSISEIKKRQFTDILKYDMIVAGTPHYDLKGITSHQKMYYENVTLIKGQHGDTQNIKMIVPESNMDAYISLNNRRTGRKIKLRNNGVVISERLSKLLNVSKGETFTFTDETGTSHNVKVNGICEMYAGHFMFMNKEEYQSVFNKKYSSNASFVKLENHSIKNTNRYASHFMNQSEVISIVQNSTLKNQIDTIVASLNKIMNVLIFVAALLSIVIIYNLTNINVCERMRELCTIKVLGFFDEEVTMYIYRETILLSFLGIIVGWIIGLLLHAYILAVVPPDEVMFNPKVWIFSYVIPFILVVSILFVLKFMVRKTMRDVDMLAALKSVD